MLRTTCFFSFSFLGVPFSESPNMGELDFLLVSPVKNTDQRQKGGTSVFERWLACFGLPFGLASRFNRGRYPLKEQTSSASFLEAMLRNRMLKPGSSLLLSPYGDPLPLQCIGLKGSQQENQSHVGPGSPLKRPQTGADPRGC